MAQKVKFLVINRPKLDTDGRTDVVLLKDDATTPMGYILKARNVETYRAFNLDDEGVGEFDSRSQAGHAIQRAFEGRSAKRALGRSTAPATETAETEEASEASVDDVLAGRTVTKEEAMAELDITRGALNKRIGRGSLKTTEVDGEVLVILS